MNRLGLLPPSSFEAQQRQVYDAYDQEVDSRSQNHIHTKDAEGSLLGPAGVLIHNPDVFKHSHGLQNAISTQVRQAGLPRHVQEIASLVVGARTQATFEIYSHSKSSGFPQQYLDDIRQGYCPPELDIEGQIAFEVVTELGRPGSLSEATWQKSVGILGLDGTTALVQCVGYYNFMSTIANGFDVQLPAAYLSEASAKSSTNSARSSISFEASESSGSSV